MSYKQDLWEGGIPISMQVIDYTCDNFQAQRYTPKCTPMETALGVRCAIAIG